MKCTLGTQTEPRHLDIIVLIHIYKTGPPRYARNTIRVITSISIQIKQIRSQI